ncbi:MAG: aminotransferase class V-fold PLP-dependent enzyme [Gammaproteobacteria bacterium]|nr:aminotransferase class V-fold PLP-dependent enzyme [Gammaproteobacteria bacterium]
MNKEENYKLELSPTEMKALGYQVIDMLVDYQTSVAGQAVKTQVAQADMEALLRESAPESGSDASALVRKLQEEILIDLEHKIHPRDFAFIPGPSNFVSVMADTIAGGLNIFSGAQLTSSAATIIELQVIDWLRQIFGFEDSAGGLFVSGGSAANLTGLAAARHLILNDDIGSARIYYSDQTHVSNIKALKLLGFQAEQFSSISTDEDFRIKPDELQECVNKDRDAGFKPFCIIANAGTTNTGAVDPLEELLAIRDTEQMWLHVDGAFGAAAALTDKGREVLKGLENVDSLSFDPHKWLFQPYEIGGIIVRDMNHLQKTFATNASYLRDIQGPDSQEVNFFDYGIQMTRGFRALKMWLSIKTFGLAAFRKAIERGIELAELVETELKKSEHWEIITPAQLGIITFRYVIAGLDESALSELNQRIVQSIVDDGFAFILTTSLRGQTVLRICAINPRTSDEDIRLTIEKLGQFGQSAAEP